MSDTTTTEPVAAATGEPEAVQESPADKPLGENGEKALKAERDARAKAEKDAAALRKQLDEIEAAKLSDLERAQKDAAEAQEALTRAKSDALRFRIAAKHSISDEDAELFLTGTDEETLERQAARLVERTPTTPRPDPSQGGTGSQPASTAQQFAEAIKARF